MPGATAILQNDDSENETLIVDCESPMQQPGNESPSKYFKHIHTHTNTHVNTYVLSLLAIIACNLKSLIGLSAD